MAIVGNSLKSRASLGTITKFLPNNWPGVQDTDRTVDSEHASPIIPPGTERRYRLAKENYWVYVLRNPAGKFYIGVTDDVARRLNDHNTGRSKWTKKHGPWEVAWQQGPMTLAQARKLENWLKRQKGGNGFYRFTGLQADSSSGS